MKIYVNFDDRGFVYIAATTKFEGWTAEVDMPEDGFDYITAYKLKKGKLVIDEKERDRLISLDV